MAHKFYYREYTNSKKATSASLALSILEYVLIIFGLLSIVVRPVSAIIVIPVIVVYHLKRHSIEEFIAKRLPDKEEYPEYTVSEEEYQKAQKIVSWGKSHPAVKEIAEMTGKKPQEVIWHYEEVIRNYNLGRYHHKK